MNPALTSQFYGRMFPSLPPSSHTEDDLIALAGFMKDDGSGDSTPFTTESGYLYWGQFLDHDITLDLTPLVDAGRIPPESRINHRSPFLDLDSLYGGGPLDTPFLYELPPNAANPGGMSYPGNERFLLGPTKSTQRLLDLPRSRIGRPLLGDPRNEENLILAQFHVLWLRFHNKIMELLDAGTAPDIGLPNASKFTQARRFVTWHYQYLVLNELLGKMVQTTVLKEVVEASRRHLAWRDGPFFIPIEFAMAAFRFGHSMIRLTYDINTDKPSVSLKTLLLKNSQGDPTWSALPDEWVVDWTLFFPMRFFRKKTGLGNVTHALDVLIAGDLHTLPSPTPLDAPGPQARPPLFSLPAMTLVRGQRSGLPSGQLVADALGEPRLSNDELVAGRSDKLKDFLMQRGFLNDTPLWYYILQEAFVSPRGPKLRLGRVGSRIVAETLISALLSDPTSILNAGRGWTPPSWPGLFSEPIDRMNNLVLALPPTG